jgi:NADH:ubiquinone oxidoreductase subunit 6 (subunit J)
LSFNLILFYVFAAVAVGATLLVVVQSNPVYSVLLLIGSFLGLAGLYVLLDAPFVAVIQIIVYAGAIMVLFLFVVMLLNAPREEIVQSGMLVARRPRVVFRGGDRAADIPGVRVRVRSDVDPDSRGDGRRRDAGRPAPR